MVRPVKVDRTFKDGGTVSLGGTTLTAHLHPGHTRGATSFTTEIRENGKIYRVVIANLGSINPGVTVTGMAAYPGIQQDYARTFAAQRAMTIDVFLASHASQFGLHENYKPGDATTPTASWIRKASWTPFGLEKAYLDQVAKERAGKVGAIIVISGPDAAPAGPEELGYSHDNAPEGPIGETACPGSSPTSPVPGQSRH